MSSQRSKPWSQTTLGKSLPIRYGKARTDKAGVVREDSPVYGSSGVIDKFDRALTNGPALIIGRKGTVGSTYYSSEPCWPIDTVYFTEASEEKDLRFFKYLLDHLQLGRMDRSTAVPGLSRDDYNAKEVAIPDIDEQQRIVLEIEKQFTRLEAGVGALRRVQANLKRYRAAVLKAACEGRLVPTEAELAKAENRKFESGEELLARILTERRQNWQGRGQYKEPAAPDTGNLPSLPSGWTWGALEAVSDAVGGFAFSSTKFVEAGYQVVKMANIRMGKIDLTQRPSFISDVTPDIVDKYSLREGDLVVTLTGTRKKRDYGYVAVVKTGAGLLLNQRIARLRPFPGMISKFLQLAMQAEHYRNRFFSHETGNVGQGNVGMAAVTKELITLPPLAEQIRIVAEVERRLSVAEELEATVSVSLQRAVRLRQSILQNIFSAPITVT
jgi:type I restriction enzyme S subunit